MRQYTFIAAMLLALPLKAYAQSSSTLIGARAHGMGYTSVCLTDQWSLFNNVAGIGKIKEFTGSTTYDINALSKSFNKAAAAINIPGKISGAIGVFRFGDKQYQEQLITVGVGDSWGITSIGVKVTYIRYSAQGFGDKAVFTVGFGGITQITPRLSVGASIININQPYLSRSDHERVPTIMTAGLLLKATTSLCVALEIEKDMDYPAVLKAGMEYIVHKRFYFRTGINLHPEAAFFGFGCKLRKFQFDYSMQYALGLGMHFQAGVSYQFRS